MTGACLQSSRPSSFEDRYRLYLDESGDHVFNCLENPSHRFLCLLGCWFRNPEYKEFHARLEDFRRAHLPHHPDEPPVLHRDDIINRRGCYTCLQDAAKAQAFDAALLDLIREAQFRVVAVVIDKLELRLRQGDAAGHPYHLAMGFVLNCYCSYLNHISRTGDVMAESRGGREDRLLADSYSRIHAHGVGSSPAANFQLALTSKQLKVKNKAGNIAGLQLADLLSHPVRQAILREQGLISQPPPSFALRLIPIVQTKFNRHLCSGIVEGYGTVFFPK